MAIANTFILATETTITVAGASDRAVLSMMLCNTDTVSHTVSIYAYPTGGSMIDQYCILKNWTIPAGDTLSFSSEDKIILQAGAKITAICDTASKISALANYMDI